MRRAVTWAVISVMGPLEGDELALFAPHRPQDVTDLAQGDVVLHGIDEEGHEVLRALGGGADAGQAGVGPGAIAAGAEGAQALGLAAADLGVDAQDLGARAVIAV